MKEIYLASFLSKATRFMIVTSGLLEGEGSVDGVSDQRSVVTNVRMLKMLKVLVSEFEVVYLYEQGY